LTKAAPVKILAALFFWIFWLVMMLALLEVSLRVVDVVSPGTIPGTRFASSPVLKSVGAPHPDHDAAGFRNDSVPEKACVVVMGDSQVYGTGVARDVTFSAQMAQTMGCPVYNMGMPGWGTAQQLAALDNAIALKPDLIITTFYLGNDLADNQAFAAQTTDMPPSAKWPSTLKEAAYMLETHTRIGQLIFDLYRYPFWREGNTFTAPEDPPCASSTILQNDKVCLNEGGIQDLLQVERRLPLLDRQNPQRIAGFEAAQIHLKEIHDKLAAQNIKHMVLLIPTKETSYALSSLDLDNVRTANWQVLFEYEGQYINETARLAVENNIPLLIASRPLSAAIDRGTQPFLYNDGHLNTQGHDVLSQALIDFLAAHDKHD